MSKADVKRLAKLARLSVSEADAEKYGAQMQDILAMVEKLPQLSSEQSLVDPANAMKFRKDESRPSWSREEILQNAPQTQAGCVVVPKTVD